MFGFFSWVLLFQVNRQVTPAWAYSKSAYKLYCNCTAKFTGTGHSHFTTHLGMASRLGSIPDVNIDNGNFKYILIKVSSEDGSEDKLIVRGDGSKNYHADIYDDVTPSIIKEGFRCDCLGGGRIIHDPAEKSIIIYGKSEGYGRADHNITCEILKKHYADYSSICVQK